MKDKLTVQEARASMLEALRQEAPSYSMLTSAVGSYVRAQYPNRDFNPPVLQQAIEDAIADGDVAWFDHAHTVLCLPYRQSEKWRKQHGH